MTAKTVFESLRERSFFPFPPLPERLWAQPSCLMIFPLGLEQP